MVSRHVSEGDQCFMCGEDNLHVLVSHHIVPRAYGGSDEQFNRVVLCANHHQAIHGIYSDAVFNRLGVQKMNGQAEDPDVGGLSDFEELTSAEQFEYLTRQMSEKELSDALAGIFVGGAFPHIGTSENAETIDEWVAEDPDEFYSLDLEEKFRYLVRNHRDVVYVTENKWANENIISAALSHAFEEIKDTKDIQSIEDPETESEPLTMPGLDEGSQAMLDYVVQNNVRKLTEMYENLPGAPKQEVVSEVSGAAIPGEAQIGVEKARQTIQRLRDLGVIYSPDRDHLRPV